MECTILEVQGVVHFYNARNIFSDVYLKCCTGEIIGIIGANGCGKSTLYKIMSGTIRSSDSFIYLNKKRIFKPQRFIKHCPAEIMLPKNTKLKDVISFLFDKTTQRTLLEYPLIATCINQKIKELSSGQAKYIQVLLFLHMDVPFVLLDEPFLGLSPIACEELISNIQKQANKGIIITDHNHEYLQMLTHQTYQLREGYLKQINIER